MVATWVLTTIFSASTSSRCRRGPIARSIAGNGHPWESGERNEQFIAGQGTDGHGCRRVADAVTAFDDRPRKAGAGVAFQCWGYRIACAVFLSSLYRVLTLLLMNAA